LALTQKSKHSRVDDGVIVTLLATEITQLLLNRRQAMREKKALEESQT